MKPKPPTPQALTASILLGLIAATGAYAGLAAYGQPENFNNRVANLEDRVTEIRRLSRAPAAARAYRAGALCVGADPEALSAISSDLQSRASGLGLTLVSLALTPATPRQGGVDRVDLQVEVTGPYPAVTGMLGSFAAQTPRMFVDRLDLTDRTTTVSLRFTGHFYCSTAT